METLSRDRTIAGCDLATPYFNGGFSHRVAAWVFSAPQRGAFCERTQKICDGSGFGLRAAMR